MMMLEFSFKKNLVGASKVCQSMLRDTLKHSVNEAYLAPFLFFYMQALKLTLPKGG